MLELLEHYSGQQIIIFIVLLAVAIREVINFCEWANGQLAKRFKSASKEEQAIADLSQQIKDLSIQLEDSVNGFREYIEADAQKQAKMEDKIEILMDSDRDDIKSWITEKHHFFCYEKGYIDDYSLECIERRFKHYQDEGGNSFIEGFMTEIRALPKVSRASATIKTNNQKEI